MKEHKTVAKEYDENGNCIYTKLPNGNEYYRKYDENNNCICTRFLHSSGKEFFYIDGKGVTRETWEKYHKKHTLTIS